MFLERRRAGGTERVIGTTARKEARKIASCSANRLWFFQLWLDARDCSNGLAEFRKLSHFVALRRSSPHRRGVIASRKSRAGLPQTVPTRG